MQRKPLEFLPANGRYTINWNRLYMIANSEWASVLDFGTPSAHVGATPKEAMEVFRRRSGTADELNWVSGFEGLAYYYDEPDEPALIEVNAEMKLDGVTHFEQGGPLFWNPYQQTIGKDPAGYGEEEDGEEDWGGQENMYTEGSECADGGVFLDAFPKERTVREHGMYPLSIENVTHRGKIYIGWIFSESERQGNRMT